MAPQNRKSLGQWLDARFGVGAAGSTLRGECLGGVTTFLSMAYIMVVNPLVLSDAGMPRDGAFLATVLASALACLLMGLFANLPVALAPGMGLNAFFAYTICAVATWQVGLGMIVWVSIVFLILTLGRVRELLTRAVPPSLRFAAAVGIGFFIALIGLKQSGLIVDNPVTLVALGDVSRPHVLLAGFGLAVTFGLLARGNRTAIFWGLLGTAVVGAAVGMVDLSGQWFQVPKGRLPGAEMDVVGAFKMQYLPLGLTLLFFALFDAMGTLYAVGAEANLLDASGRFPRLGRALMADATGALGGGLLGTSSVTCYIESATGVSVGARTGLASCVTAAAFLASLFVAPLVATVGAGVTNDGATFYPVTAPALIAVGVLMSRSVTRIDWADVTEAVPAFLTITLMPFTFSIAHGLAIGFISYAFMKLISGRFREAHWLVYLLAALFGAHYYFFLGGVH